MFTINGYECILVRKKHGQYVFDNYSRMALVPSSIENGIITIFSNKNIKKGKFIYDERTLKIIAYELKPSYILTYNELRKYFSYKDNDEEIKIERLGV